MRIIYNYEIPSRWLSIETILKEIENDILKTSNSILIKIKNKNLNGLFFCIQKQYFR